MSDPVKPAHGFTRHGLAVHLRTYDHLRTDSAYQRFNKKIALMLTKNVGTMTCFWIFIGLCLTVLPSVLHAMGVLRTWVLPTFLLGFGFELLTTWIFSTLFQLVLLPALMVGQNLQNEAADSRAAKQFEDTETILDRLDCDTAGGLKILLDRLDEMGAQFNAAIAGVRPGPTGAN